MRRQRTTIRPLHRVVKDLDQHFWSKRLKKRVTLKDIESFVCENHQLEIYDLNRDIDITLDVLVKIALGKNYIITFQERNSEKMSFIIDLIARLISRDEIEEAIRVGGFEEQHLRERRGLSNLNLEVLSC